MNDGRVTRIPVHQCTAVVGREQPLVRVDDETVGAFDAVEAVPDRRGEQRGETVGTVDVQPEVALLADVGDRCQFVDDPGVGGASGGDDGEHRDTLRFVERGVERGAGETAGVIDGNADDLAVEHPGR